MTSSRKRRWATGLAAGALLAIGLGGCQEELTAPADCPELCPSGSAEVQELLLSPLLGSDSSHSPYLNPGNGVTLLVSNGLPAAEARTAYRFLSRPDSIVVRDTARAYAIDSVTLSFGLLARDTLTPGLKVFVYRLPETVDEGITFADVDPLLVESNIIDSILVPDTLKVGRIETVLQGPELEKVALPVGGALAVGIAMTASQPSGIRLGSSASGAGPSFITHTTVDVPDTAVAVKKQPLLRTPAFSTFVLASPPATDTTLLTVGGAPSSRSLLRFDLPDPIEDSAAIVRATLELVPAGPVLGLPTDPSFLVASAVLADLGAKSPIASGAPLVTLDTLEPGTADTVRMDVTRLVQSWQDEAELPEAIFLSLNPEAASFMRPEFGSSRRPDIGVPRLRVTYQARFPFENP